jgi:peptidoglycan/LPS O-acetylase OafA/YrhL
MRYSTLDGWRGLCALAVAVFHLPLVSHLTELGLIRHAWLFVDFFFVLSGFILSHVYLPRLNEAAEIAPFMLRRFGRLWPLHIVMLGIFILLECGKLVAWQHGIRGEEVPFTASHAVSAIPTNILLIQAMGLQSLPTWNGASWSISTEIWVSLLFALIVLYARQWLLVLCAALAALSCLVVAYWSPDFMQADGTWAFFRCTFGFFVGVLAYSYFAGPNAARRRNSYMDALAECSAIAAIVAFVTIASGPWSLVGPLVFGVAVVVFSREEGPISLILKFKPLRRLGELSFAIYMVNELIAVVMSRGLKAAGILFGHPFPVIRYQLGDAFLLHDRFIGDLAVIASCALVLLAARLAWQAIEVPCRKYVYGKARQLDGRLRAASENGPAVS